MRLLPPLLYGAGHPYAIPFSGSGDEASIAALTRDDLVAWHHDFVRPQGATLIVVGDTTYDAEAAGKAGLKTIGVLCGGFPDNVLRQAGCVAIYRDPADLLENYGSSPLAG